MLKETCFSDLKKVHAANPDAIYIIVSRSKPSYVIYNRWYMALAPSKSLFRDYKNGLCDEEEYTRRFTEQISKSKIAQERIQTIRELLKEKKDIYLICWEKTGFCHRFLLMDMIEGKKVKQATLEV